MILPGGFYFSENEVRFENVYDIIAFMQKSAKLSVIIGAIVVGISGIIALTQPRLPGSVGGYVPSSGNQPSPIQSQSTSTEPAAQSAIPAAYTLAYVAKHADQLSCWSAVNGNVYDLTSWIAQHPGGEGAILSICGKDGSAAFNNQHGGQGRPEAILQTFKIGALSNS